MVTSNLKKIVFMGSSPFAAAVLAALCDIVASNNATIAAVYSQPPRPQQRGKKIEKTMVQDVAEKKSYMVRTPTTFDRAEVEFLSALAPDIIVVVAYGLLLPAAVLAVPSIMAMNIHPSLLPRHRGATPIETSLLMGDDTSGVSLIKMTPDLDAGDVFAMERLAVAPDDNRDSLGKKLLALSIAMIKEQLPKLLGEEITLAPQDHAAASYGKKITKGDYQLNPAGEDSTVVDRKIRAYYPKAYILLPNGKRLQLLVAKKTNGQGGQGQQGIYYDGTRLLLPCDNNSAVELVTVKPENKNAMAAIDWWRGWRQ